jgi:hypothetical protein
MTPAAARSSTTDGHAGRPHDHAWRAAYSRAGLAVSAGSARCTTAPTRRSSSATNRQPVVASGATSSFWPRNDSQNRRTPRAVRRRYPRPRDLARFGIDPLRSDLRSMLIQSHHDRHLQGLLTLHALRGQTRARTEEGLHADPDIRLLMPSIRSRRRSSGGDGRHNEVRPDPGTDRQDRLGSARRPPENQPHGSDVTARLVPR